MNLTGIPSCLFQITAEVRTASKPATEVKRVMKPTVDVRTASEDVMRVVMPAAYVKTASKPTTEIKRVLKPDLQSEKARLASEVSV